MRHINSSRFAQRGAALAIGLILLAVTSLVTITAINTGAMQERMSANQDNHARAFMAAEAGGAQLVSEIRNLIRTNQPLPTTHPLPDLRRVVAADPTATFDVTLVPQSPAQSWNDPTLRVWINGHARSSDGDAVLARTRLLVELRQQPGTPGTPVTPGTPPPPAFDATKAPAAISCFGGPCRITAGAGRGADEGFGTVSGFDHPIPPLDCSGSGCRMQPQGVDRLRVPPVPPPTPPAPLLTAVPAVYLTHPTGSSISRSGGGSFNAFQGLNRAGTGIVSDNDMDVVRRPVDYPNDPATGTSTAPLFDTVFGVPVPTTSRLESGRTTLTAIGGSNFEVGMLVLNGEHLTMQGNALFVGLIVIQNCGTLRMGGNPNIYGAVVVNATGCAANYDPFGGQGTPALRFSREALRAANPPGGGTGGGTGGGAPETSGEVTVQRWVEILE